jgi:hypothetical protein
MSSAGRALLECAIRQLDCAEQQLASAMVINGVVKQALKDALGSDEASRALGQVAWRRNYDARQEEAALGVLPVPAQREETA